ncbi:MAG TPA: EamA family transporter [Acetobacteraceae bacterium]
MTDPCTIAGLALYGIAALLYIVALRRISLSVALPCTALSYIGVVLIGHYHFGEAVTAVQLVGMIVVCIGVLLLALP